MEVNEIDFKQEILDSKIPVLIDFGQIGVHHAK